MKNAGIWLLAIICVGCASSTLNSTTLSVTPQNLWDAPTPTPAFLERLEPVTDETGTHLGTCIEFSGLEIGLTNDNGDEVSRILTRTLNISVDGIKINDWVDASNSWFGRTVCFDHSDVGYGLHVAGIELETISGKSYTYMWAFKILADNDGKSTVIYPDSLQS